MKYKGFKKLVIFLVMFIGTCAIITVDREASIMHNRDPLLELSVTRISEKHFEIKFLGNSKNVEAAPIEKWWNDLKNSIERSIKKTEPVWEEIILALKECTYLADKS